MEEQVEQALARGFAAIGFSDHSYTDFDLRYCMKPEQEEGYHREITRLKRAYEGRIEVYAGQGNQRGSPRIGDPRLSEYACRYGQRHALPGGLL